MNTPLNRMSAGRVAIVTGGSRGVGRAIVRSLSTRGYAVAVNYLHDQHAAESTVETVLADNGTAVAVRADAADELDVERLFAETEWMFGGIDVVVHAVSRHVTAIPVTEVDLEVFDDLCRMNTRAALIVDREAARQIRDGGAIINLTSTAVGSPRPSYGPLAATKAATDVLTRVLALELRARDITVNAVSLQVDRPCAPGKVVDAVAYLLSADGHGLTGQVIDIDEPR
jgi:3-oxoacyl-[acyl-carrier protein] reductase